MNDIRMWTLGVAIALLASSDPADGIEPPAHEKHALEMKIGKASIRAVEREIEKDGKKQLHTFLEVSGDLKTKVSISLYETSIRPMSRVMPMPRLAWKRDIAIDSQKCRSVDLGVLAASPGSTHRELQASTDGKSHVTLLRKVTVMTSEAPGLSRSRAPQAPAALRR